MSINIYNIRTYNKPVTNITKYVCRPYPLGNPWPLRTEKDRIPAILKYEDYFHRELENKDSRVYKAVQEIIELYKSTGELDLLCFCNYPNEECHAQVIKDYILGVI